jgi:hypothetical protein
LTAVTLRRLIALACLVAALAVAGSARADDKKKAAEHFALAEKAEARQDWRAAIAEYQLAYDASPHPSVLFNIAKNHERLGEARDAARFFQRYLDESGSPDDRAAVEERIRELRARPSKVQIIARPVGAQVIVDGEARGAAPLTITLTAGEHELVLEAGGRRSAPQSIELAFGDPITVRMDLETRPGTLMVFANEDGAAILIDGKLAGHTPYTGQVPAGDYELTVEKPGFQTAMRKVTVSPGGSRQVRFVLIRAGGEPEPPPASGKYLFGWSLGFDVGADGIRYLLDLGYRTPNDRLELSLLLGTLGGEEGAGAGLESRLFFLVGRVRPYVRAAVLAGQTTGTSSDRVTLIEGGGGVLFVGTKPGDRRAGRKRYSLDYFLEVDVNLRLQEPADDQQRLGIPLIGGILFRWGG